MKKVLFISPVAMAIAFGLFITSCNTKTNESTSTTTTTDTTKKVVTTAPATGKVVTGPKIDIHAVGNTMTEMHYDVSEIHVKAGENVDISLTNDGTDAAMVHNIVICKPEDADSVASHGLLAGMSKNFVPDEAAVIASTKLANPGMKVNVSFKAPEKGEYLFICSYPGHYKQMRGKFIVE